MKTPVDAKGRALCVGDEVARAHSRGNRAFLEFRTVTRVEESRVYLDNSHVPIYRLDALLVLTK